MNVRFFAALLTLAASVSLSTMHAQVNTSTISGSVVDESGSGVPNAKVVTTIIATGQQRDAMTNGVGEFVLPQLAPGELQNYCDCSRLSDRRCREPHAEHRRASIDQRSSQAGPSQRTGDDRSIAPLLEQETASLGQVITRKAINDLPLNGRNYLTLGSLSPGVIPQLPASTGPSSFIASTSQRSDRSLLVGGQRESASSYLYDGVEMRNPRIGDSSITPSLDAVQEFKIQRNFFQAEFGNSPAIINVASRGGYEPVSRHAVRFPPQ